MLLLLSRYAWVVERVGWWSSVARELGPGPAHTVTLLFRLSQMTSLIVPQAMGYSTQLVHSDPISGLLGASIPPMICTSPDFNI
jgi:hypothetical protein